MNKQISIHYLTLGLALLAGPALAGCSDDAASEGPAGATATSGSGSGGGASVDPRFASCSRGELEPEEGARLALQGKGVDPATKKLKPGSYVVSTTYLALVPEMSENASQLSGPVIASLSTMKGLAASAFAQSSSCATLRTLTVWETEEDLFAFVGSPDHAKAMSEIGNVSRGTSRATTWEATEEGATWEEAARQLAIDTGSDL